MPRSKRGIKRVFPNQTYLECAVNEVSGNSLTVTEAVSIYNISKTTLLRHIKLFKSSKNDSYSYTSNINHSLVFTTDEEKELVDYLKMSARLQYGLTKTDTRKLAFQFVVKNGKNVKEWENTEGAGKE